MKTSQVVEELIRIKIDFEQQRSYAAMSRVDFLIEKLLASREGKSDRLEKSHHNNCLLETNSDYYGPCTCHKYTRDGYVIVSA